MTTPTRYTDAFARLSQAGDERFVRLVRIDEWQSANTYLAHELRTDATGALERMDDASLHVTNLAEPADEPGRLPPETDAAAVDVEGKWFICLRPASALVVAKVTAAPGGAEYTVRPQVLSELGVFTTDPDAGPLTAWNLAELTLGPGAAVDVDALVLVLPIVDGAGLTRYVFHHPAYAKYLD